MFASLRSNVISLVCLNKFLACLEKGEGTGEQLPPSKSVKNAMISRITMRYFSTLDLTQIFEKTFHQFAHFTTTFLVFSGLAFKSRVSKDKNVKES